MTITSIQNRFYIQFVHEFGYKILLLTVGQWDISIKKMSAEIILDQL